MVEKQLIDHTQVEGIEGADHLAAYLKSLRDRYRRWSPDVALSTIQHLITDATMIAGRDPRLANVANLLASSITPAGISGLRVLCCSPIIFVPDTGKVRVELWEATLGGHLKTTLTTLAANKYHPVTYTQIAPESEDSGWSRIKTMEVARVRISRLRHALDRSGLPYNWIHNYHNVGWVLDPKPRLENELGRVSVPDQYRQIDDPSDVPSGTAVGQHI